MGRSLAKTHYTLLLSSKCKLITLYIALPYLLTTSYAEAWLLCLDKVLYTHLNHCSVLLSLSVVSDTAKIVDRHNSLQNVRLYRKIHYLIYILSKIYCSIYSSLYKKYIFTFILSFILSKLSLFIN